MTNRQRNLEILSIVSHFRHYLDMNFMIIFCETEILVW